MHKRIPAHACVLPRASSLSGFAAGGRAASPLGSPLGHGRPHRWAATVAAHPVWMYKRIHGDCFADTYDTSQTHPHSRPLPDASTSPTRLRRTRNTFRHNPARPRHISPRAHLRHTHRTICSAPRSRTACAQALAWYTAAVQRQRAKSDIPKPRPAHPCSAVLSRALVCPYSAVLSRTQPCSALFSRDQLLSRGFYDEPAGTPKLERESKMR